MEFTGCPIPILDDARTKLSLEDHSLILRWDEDAGRLAAVGWARDGSDLPVPEEAWPDAGLANK